MTDLRLLDVNVLVALTQAGHAMNQSAHRWMAEMMASGAAWATCPTTESSYLRLSTNPAVVGRAITAPEALDSLASLRAVPQHRFLADPTSLSDSRVDLSALVGSKQVTDFHLLNLAASSNAVLATFDRGLLNALAPLDRALVELIPV